MLRLLYPKSTHKKRYQKSKRTGNVLRKIAFNFNWTMRADCARSKSFVWEKKGASFRFSERTGQTIKWETRVRCMLSWTWHFSFAFSFQTGMWNKNEFVNSLVTFRLCWQDTKIGLNALQLFINYFNLTKSAYFGKLIGLQCDQKRAKKWKRGGGKKKKSNLGCEILLLVTDENSQTTRSTHLCTWM